MPQIDYKLVDPEIRKLIKTLNDLGYVTAGSCAGHKGSEDSPEGNIALMFVVGKEHYPTLLKICLQYGCKNVHIDVASSYEAKPKYNTMITFNPIGEPWKTWKVKRPKYVWKKMYGVK